MEVHFTPEQEQQLAEMAIRIGTDPEQLVKTAALHLLEAETRSQDIAPELPLWDLGATGPLHRTDIYDDVH